MLAIVGVALLAAQAAAQDPEDLRRGVARISFINGEVSVQRGDSGEWMGATLNAPVLGNDRIATGVNSRAEVEFENGIWGGEP